MPDDQGNFTPGEVTQMNVELGWSPMDESFPDDPSSTPAPAVETPAVPATPAPVVEGTPAPATPTTPAGEDFTAFQARLEVEQRAQLEDTAVRATINQQAQSQMQSLIQGGMSQAQARQAAGEYATNAYERHNHAQSMQRAGVMAQENEARKLASEMSVPFELLKNAPTPAAMRELATLHSNHTKQVAELQAQVQGVIKAPTQLLDSGLNTSDNSDLAKRIAYASGKDFDEAELHRLGIGR